MKKKLLISAVSAIVLLAATALLVFRNDCKSFFPLSKNIDALTSCEGPVAYYRAPCMHVWSADSDNSQMFLFCGRDYDPFMKPDKIYSCEIGIGTPYSSGECIFDGFKY